MTTMEHQPDEQADDGSPVEVTTTYLDLDGDGVIDVVQTVGVAAVDVTDDGTVDVVEVLEELAAGIGVDGVPDQVTVLEDGQVSVGGDDEPAPAPTTRPSPPGQGLVMLEAPSGA